MHVLDEGAISPNSCSECELEFEALEKGEGRNTFVVIAKRVKAASVLVDTETEQTHEIVRRRTRASRSTD